MLNEYKKTLITSHYVFHFKNNSLAEKDILLISQTQENCYNKITKLLNIKPTFKINYFLIESPEEVGLIYSEIYNNNDKEPCNAFTHYPTNTIYCVYNEKIKCIGMHEDTHIISYTKLRPRCAFLREGLAMFMDKVWHGLKNEKHVYNLINSGTKLDLYKCLENQYFFNIDCNISYPFAGAFIAFLIEKVGLDLFLNELYYTKKNYTKQLNKLFNNQDELYNSFYEFINSKNK